MAVEPVNGERQPEMQAHVRDYSAFIRMFKYGAVASFLIAMLVLVIIS